MLLCTTNRLADRSYVNSQWQEVLQGFIGPLETLERPNPSCTIYSRPTPPTPSASFERSMKREETSYPCHLPRVAICQQVNRVRSAHRFRRVNNILFIYTLWVYSIVRRQAQSSFSPLISSWNINIGSLQRAGVRGDLWVNLSAFAASGKLHGIPVMCTWEIIGSTLPGPRTALGLNPYSVGNQPLRPPPLSRLHLDLTLRWRSPIASQIQRLR